MALLRSHQTGTGGGLLKYHSASRIQRGSGLFSFFGKLLSKLAPVAKSAVKAASTGIKQVAKSDLVKDLKDIAVTSLTNSAADLVTGETPVTSLKEGLESAKQEIAKTLRNTNKKRKTVLEPKKDNKKKKVNSLGTKLKKPYNLLDISVD